MVDALPRGVLTLLAVGMAVYALMRMAAEISERFAAILGPLGAKWVRARDRRISRIGDVEELQGAIQRRDVAMERMQLEIDYLRKARADDQENIDLRRQVMAQSATIVRLREREAITDAYLVYDHDWHRRDALGEPTGPFVSFYEFEQQRKAVPDAPRPPTVGGNLGSDSKGPA